MKHLFLAALATIFMQGCASVGHKDFYSQVAPTTYSPTDKILVFQYANVNIKEIYDLLFSDYLIIGRSGFNGPYEDPTTASSFARSIGTNVLISTSQFKETQTSFVSISNPTLSTTYLSGYSGSGPFYGTATTYGTQKVPSQNTHLSMWYLMSD